MFNVLRYVSRTYQDGVLIAACQMGNRHTSLDAAIEVCGGPAALMNTHNCDPIFRNLKCCDCVDCAVKRAAIAGAKITNMDIPVTHRDVFYNLPIKIMWPFWNAIALDNTIYILSDKQVNHPAYQMGELEPIYRVRSLHRRVSTFDWYLQHNDCCSRVCCFSQPSLQRRQRKDSPRASLLCPTTSQ